MKPSDELIERAKRWKSRVYAGEHFGKYHQDAEHLADYAADRLTSGVDAEVLAALLSASDDIAGIDEDSLPLVADRQLIRRAAKTIGAIIAKLEGRG